MAALPSNTCDGPHVWVSTGGTGGGVPADAVGVCLIACLFFSYFAQSERLSLSKNKCSL